MNKTLAGWDGTIYESIESARIRNLERVLLDVIDISNSDDFPVIALERITERVRAELGPAT